MAPQDVLERTARVRTLATARPRITVTELSRSKDWREQLPEVGVMEITDRGETAGWLLSPEDMSALLERIAYLEYDSEAAQITEIFATRGEGTPLTGTELQDAVMDDLDLRGEELRSLLDAA